MDVTLYVVPGSHPSMAARLMLDHKGVAYRRVDLVPAMHKVLLRAMRFPGATVPALRIDGERVVGSKRIARLLDERFPDRPLFPAEPSARERVAAAEGWGEGVLQPVPRRLAWWVMRRDRSLASTFQQGANLPVPAPVATAFLPFVAWAASRFNGSTDSAVKADLGALPGLLDKVDELLAQGVIGGPALNAADFQIGTSVRLLAAFEDLMERVERRPAGGHARRVVPDHPGRLPAAFPKAWIR
ncbi:MAG: glutathione S-transferase [Acidobacteriota bacterium]